MKNIHLIQTDKPTGLFESQSGGLHYSIMNKVRTGLLKGYHIYITSDEEIKEDWILIIDDFETYVHKHKGDNLPTTYHKKIILTTDPDLIVDGVQAIDGEFSEWFVKNPSCEEVKTRKIGEEWIYNADVPQEEPKHISAKPFLDNADEVIVIHRPKQETLEEAAKKYKDLKLPDDLYDAFIEGAKWQVERMFNEKDMKQFAWQCVGNFLSNRDNEVEQKLVDVIIDRNNLEFEKFKKK